jgi:hypothetical protein
MSSVSGQSEQGASVPYQRYGEMELPPEKSMPLELTREERLEDKIREQGDCPGSHPLNLAIVSFGVAATVGIGLLLAPHVTKKNGGLETTAYNWSIVILAIAGTAFVLGLIGHVVTAKRRRRLADDIIDDLRVALRLPRHPRPRPLRRRLMKVPRGATKDADVT